MSSFPALDIAIGIAFIMTFLCLMATGIQEFISHLLDQRYTTLRSGVASILHTDDDSAWVQSIFQHPLVTSLVRDTGDDGAGKPSYIPAQAFAQVVIGRLREAAGVAAQGAVTTQALIDAAPNEAFKKTLQAMAHSGEISVAELQTKLAAHFDATMERASGWYKRKAQTMLLAIGFALAVILNTNLATLPERLYRDPVLRAQLVTVAEKQNATPALLEQSAATLQLPIGWHSFAELKSTDGREWALRVVGWMLTAAAISLGAPFWFDLLSHFVNLRAVKRIGSDASAGRVQS